MGERAEEGLDEVAGYTAAGEEGGRGWESCTLRSKICEEEVERRKEVGEVGCGEVLGRGELWERGGGERVVGEVSAGTGMMAGSCGGLELMRGSAVAGEEGVGGEGFFLLKPKKLAVASIAVG